MSDTNGIQTDDYIKLVGLGALSAILLAAVVGVSGWTFYVAPKIINPLNQTIKTQNETLGQLRADLVAAQAQESVPSTEVRRSEYYRAISDLCIDYFVRNGESAESAWPYCVKNINENYVLPGWFEAPSPYYNYDEIARLP